MKMTLFKRLLSWIRKDPGSYPNHEFYAFGRKQEYMCVGKHIIPVSLNVCRICFEVHALGTHQNKCILKILRRGIRERCYEEAPE